jgi:hypothetical protein
VKRSGLFLLSLLLLGMKGEPYRYSRELHAKPGWSVIDLPDDVLAAARPGLPDLRISGKDGELGYVLEHELAPVAPRLEFRNVELLPARETTALLDRRESPPTCTELELEIAGSEPFLKPVSVEASADARSFALIAQGSIFRLSPDAKMPRVRFAPSDRRYFRIRLDDRNGAPLHPVAARCLQHAAPAAPLREVALRLEPSPRDDAIDRFSLVLPSANLPIAALRLSVNGLAFAREARVYEPLLFRNELSRRLVGFGRLERSATGEERTTILLGELSGSTLELEIDRPGAPLDVRQATALVQPKRLVFVAPETGPLTLLYGSQTATTPRYDLAAALARGRPSALAPAQLGSVRDAGTTAALAPPPRTLLAGPEGWKRRQRITLPAKGPVAYLDLERDAANEAHSVRIVDANGRQVPFLVEASERSVLRPLTFTQTTEGTRTLVEVSVDPADPLTGLELVATAPAYFERDVTVFVPTRDARGPTGQRELSHARWVKRPEDSTASFSIPLSINGESKLLITIANADNPPLTLSKIEGRALTRRIDFLFEPGDALELLTENSGATAPRYDLELIASAVLGSPALPATLAAAPVVVTPAEKPGTPKWFWWVAVGSGLLVVLALVRVQKKEAS